MGVLGKFESKVEGAVDGAASAMFSSPIEPAQIAKKAEKQMKKEKLVGSGRQYAPTLYNVLVNERDDKRLFGFYPTMASEIENYLYAKGTDAGMEFDTRPLVRFIPDPGLKKGRFDVIAEVVAAPIIKKLRAEEQEYYGLTPKGSAAAAEQAANAQYAQAAPAAQAHHNQGAQASAYQNNAYQGNAQASYAAGAIPSPVSERFAGLDTPVDVNEIPGQSGAAPLGKGRIPSPASSANDQWGAGIASPAAAAGAGAGAGVHISALRGGDAPAYDSGGELPVQGNASLFNLGEQRQYRLESRKLTLGRGKDNDITLADANASRVHARLSQDATGTWKLTDLGSTNGTQLNGRDVSSAILRSGDEITIGTTVLQFTE